VLPDGMRSKNGDEDGLLITIEGGHGCGKSAISSMLCKRLRDLGLQVIETADQQGTNVGRRIVKINLEHRSEAIVPLTEALLIAAASHQNVEEVIKPNLKHGKIVVCERYNDAFFVFQGFARGLPQGLLRCISDAVTDGITPDLTILLDADPRIALARIEVRQRHRIEREALGFHEKVRNGYLALAKEHPERIEVFEASLPLNVVFQNVWERVKKLVLPV